MTIDLNTLMMYLGFPLILSLGTYVVRSLLQRIETLEGKMSNTVSEPQVRQLLQDRYDPIMQDIYEIKQMQQKLLDLYLQVQNKENK